MSAPEGIPDMVIDPALREQPMIHLNHQPHPVNAPLGPSNMSRPATNPPTPQPVLDQGPSELDVPPPPMLQQQQQPLQPEEPLHTMPDAQNGAQERQLNVTDALSYLDAVKMQFQDQPDVYNVFLDIMKDFKSQLIDTPGVISRVSKLFHGHPSLIQGFNTFLPLGYRIDVGPDARAEDFIRVTTPSGTVNYENGEPALPRPPPEVIDDQRPLPPLPLSHLVPPPPPPEPSWAQQVQPVAGPSRYRSPIPPPPAPLPLVHPPPPDVAQAHLHGEVDEGDEKSLRPAMEYVQRIKTRFTHEPEKYKQFLEILSKHKSDDGDRAAVFAKVEELFVDAPDLAREFHAFIPGAGGPASLDQQRSYSPTPTGNKRKHAQTDAPPAKRKKRADARDRERERPTASSSKHAKKPRAQSPAPTAPVPSDTFFARVKRVLGGRETYAEFMKVINLFAQGFIDRSRLIREASHFLGAHQDLMTALRELLGWGDVEDRAAAARERGEVNAPPAGRLDRSRDALHVRYGSYRRLPPDEQKALCSGRDELCREVLNDEWVAHPAAGSEETGFGVARKNAYEDALHRTEEERHEYDFHLDGVQRTIALLEPLVHKIGLLPADERASFKLKANFGNTLKPINARIVRKIYGREAGAEVLSLMQDSPGLAIPIVYARLKQKEEEWRRAQAVWNKVWREADALNAVRALDYRAVAFRAADKKALTAKAMLAQADAAAAERRRGGMEFVLDDERVLGDVMKLAMAFLARLAGTPNRLESGKRAWAETRLFNVLKAFFGLESGVFAKQVDGAAGAGGSANGGAGGDEEDRGSRRVFYASAWFYVLLRMIEILYSRLHRFKELSHERAPVHQGVRPEKYYELMLETVERLFDGAIDVPAFEEQMRGMFGVQEAYKLFTIDKVLASLTKHLTGFDTDTAKHERLMKLLWDERRIARPGPDEHRRFRSQAESALGPDETLFRLEWYTEGRVMALGIVGREGGGEDAEVASGRWQAYVESFVGPGETKGVPRSKLRSPFLRRNLPSAARTSPNVPPPPEDVAARGGLEIKVCVRTYRIFYVSGGEESIWHLHSADEVRRAVERGSVLDEERTRRFGEAFGAERDVR